MSGSIKSGAGGLLHHDLMEGYDFSSTRELDSTLFEDVKRPQWEQTLRDKWSDSFTPVEPARTVRDRPETVSLFEEPVGKPTISLPKFEGKENGGAAPSSEDPTVNKVKGLRLRRRGRLTNVLESAWKETAVWWSDLDCGNGSAARSWLASYGGGAVSQITDGKVLKVVGDNEVERNLELVRVPMVNGDVSREVWVCPELLAKLASVRLFRAPSATLLANLRSRARLWAQEVGVSSMDLVRFMPGTLALALPMPDEVASVGVLRGSAARWGVSVLGQLDKGKLVSNPDKPLGNYLRGPLSWFFRKEDERVLAAGVETLSLPS